MGGTTIVLLLSLVFCCVRSSVDVIVQTKYGKLRGMRTKFGETYLNTFLGVPFALAPTGPRRFQGPQRVESWTGVRDALQYGPACPQSHTHSWLKYSEDCLYLNIYSPQSTATSPSKPVMVFIHGGGYVAGTGAIYNPTELALRDVVMITINYRLGIFGYLTTEDIVAPGNYGMLDQVLALKWVRDCIASFGGNPDQVTIFGESAGATSVSLHLISPLSKGLFQGAIIESGVSLSPWAVALSSDHPSPREIASIAGSRVGCSSANSKSLVQCLRNIDANTLYKASYNVPILPTDRYSMWSPVIETFFGFLPDSPDTLIKSGAMAKVSVIRGTNKDEEANIVNKIPNAIHGVKLGMFMAIMEYFVKARFHKNENLIQEAIKHVYISNPNGTKPIALRSALLKIFSDYAFIAPTVLETNFQAKWNVHLPVYMYTFNHRSPNDWLPPWEGIPHARELPYVFGEPLTNSSTAGIKWTESDKIVSEYLITMWTNFAKYSNPTPDPVGRVTWKPFTQSLSAYIYIDTNMTLNTDLRHDEMVLWNYVIPHLSQKKIQHS